MSDTPPEDKWSELQETVSSILHDHQEGRIEGRRIQNLARIMTLSSRNGILAGSTMYLATRNMAPVLTDIVNAEVLDESSHRLAIVLLCAAIEGGAGDKSVVVTESLLNALWKALAYSSLQRKGAQTFRFLASEYGSHRRLRKYFDNALVTKHHDLLEWTENTGPAIAMLKEIYQVGDNHKDFPERSKTGKLDLVHAMLWIVDKRISEGCLDASADVQRELMPILNYALLMGRGEDEMVGGLVCKLLTRFCRTQEIINGRQVLGAGLVPHVVHLVHSSKYVVAIRALKCIIVAGGHSQTSDFFIKGGALEEISQLMHVSGFSMAACIALKTLISRSPSLPQETDLIKITKMAVSLLRETAESRVKLCVLSLLIVIAKSTPFCKVHANEIIDGILSLMGEESDRNQRERLLLHLEECVDVFKDQVCVRRRDIAQALQHWEHDDVFDSFPARLCEILDWRP